MAAHPAQVDEHVKNRKNRLENGKALKAIKMLIKILD